MAAPSPKIAFVVTTAPNVNLTATAINIVSTALSSGYEVVGVFFYQQGVLNAAAHVSIPNDEFQAAASWQTLHETYNLPLHVCTTAAEKHGLNDELTEGSNIAKSFTISGLGELVELTVSAEKVIQL